jgi:hypothetical protein
MCREFLKKLMNFWVLKMESASRSRFVNAVAKGLSYAMSNSGPSRCILYSFFLSSLALHVSGVICTHK